MNWLTYALLALVTYGIFDFFVKQTGGKINDGLGNLIISIIPVIAMLVYTAYLYFTGDKIFEMKPGGLLFATLAGITISFASLFFLKTFSAGANLTIGIPLVRAGMILVSVLLGVIILREPLQTKQVLGLILAVAGLTLLLGK